MVIFLQTLVTSIYIEKSKSVTMATFRKISMHIALISYSNNLLHLCNTLQGAEVLSIVSRGGYHTSSTTVCLCVWEDPVWLLKGSQSTD